MQAVAKGQAKRWGSHLVSACFVDLLKPGRDGDLVTFHVHHALLDQERQGAFGFPQVFIAYGYIIYAPEYIECESVISFTL